MPSVAVRFFVPIQDEWLGDFASAYPRRVIKRRPWVAQSDDPPYKAAISHARRSRNADEKPRIALRWRSAKPMKRLAILFSSLAEV